VVTKVNGLREVLEIDDKPAAEVYASWVGDSSKDMQAAFNGTEEEANVLGPSSFFPMGQHYGTDEFGDPYYRIMHPHLIKKSTKSFTLFSDVEVGQKILLMAGTADNLINRISHAARFISRNGGLSVNEIVGAAAIYCGGCMMAVKDDMPTVADRLNKALNNAPHMATHTFGEQGQFPDGKSQHGNLMFSVLVFSNKRVIDKCINLDTGETIDQNDEQYVKLVEEGLLQPPRQKKPGTLNR
jgi:hypothetical protein